MLLIDIIDGPVSIMPTMARQLTLPPSLPPRLLPLEAAAAYVSVAPATFLKMVDAGTMPRPRSIWGQRKGWDVRHLDNSVDALPIAGDNRSDRTWDD